MKEIQIVEIRPTQIWIESGIFGERVVVVQHEGTQAFDYAVFNYSHYYTDNASTMADATRLAVQLGAVEPIEMRQRAIPADWLKAGDATRATCSCEACMPQGDGFKSAMRMILCATCGNKRCPHATDHSNACTGSNEPGQKGSSWENYTLPGKAKEST